MPLVNLLGEQSINASTSEDQPGFGTWLIPDSDLHLFGFVQEFVSGDPRLALFIVHRNGSVTEPVKLPPDLSYSIVAWDQDAFLIFPTNEDFDAFPPTIFRVDSEPYLFEGDVHEFPPIYVFTDQNLFHNNNGELVPAGRSTEAIFAFGKAHVYVAPDGDGTGIFLDVRDGEGNRIGGVVRVNDDVAGDQTAPIVGGMDETFTVAWTQQSYNGANSELYRAKTFELSSNLHLNVKDSNSTYKGDAGDYVTDIFFLDSDRNYPMGNQRFENFGRNDILVTTTKIFDSNNDGIINFGGNKRLELDNSEGDTIASVSVAGVQSLEYDGEVQSWEDGRTYYVYSRVGSEADEHYLIV